MRRNNSLAVALRGTAVIIVILTGWWLLNSHLETMGFSSAQTGRTFASIRRRCLKVVSQNLLGIKPTNTNDRLEEMLAALRKDNVYALLGQETWRAGSEILQHEGGFVVIAEGPPVQNGRGSKGVAIALSPQAVQGWEKGGKVVCDGYGGRVIGVRTVACDGKGRERGIFLVSAYAPIGAAPQADWDVFFSDLEDCIAKKQNNDILLIGADINSSLGRADNGSDDAQDAASSPIGSFGLKHRNASGERFYTFLASNGLRALSTFFKKKHYGSWCHPRSKKLHQLDHILVESKDFNNFTDCGRSTQVVSSDHMPVRCKLRLESNLKRAVTDRNKMLRKDFSSLLGPTSKKEDEPTPSDEARTKFCLNVLGKMSEEDFFEVFEVFGEAPVTAYQKLSNAVQSAMRDLPKKGKKSPVWFELHANSIRPLIDKRNALAGLNFSKPTVSSRRAFIDAREAVKNAVIAAKNAWIVSMCDKVDSIAGMGSGGHLACWGAIKELRGGLSKVRKIVAVRMTKSDGTKSKSDQEDADVHAEHCEKLYGKMPSGDMLAVFQMLKQHPILHDLADVPEDEEFTKIGVGNLNLSGPGITGTHAAVWKALLQVPETKQLVYNIVIDFWETEEAPEEWEHGLLKILPKKGDLSLPGNYRGIMLLEVAYKIVANIIQKRLIKVHQALNNLQQCGFLPGVGCNDANYTVRGAAKKRREHGLETWILFIDLVKAFDTVNREMLWEVLLRLGVPDKLVRLLKALHKRVVVHLEVGGVAKTILSIIGVKQGDVLGPVLFILFMAAVLMTWRELPIHKEEGMENCVFRTKFDDILSGRPQHTGGQSARGCVEFPIDDSEFADDAGFLFCSRPQVDVKVPELYRHFKVFGLLPHSGTKKKASKTECLFVSAPPQTYSIDQATFDDGAGPADLSEIEVGDGTTVPVVENFKYLGSMVSRDAKSIEDVTMRVQKASNAFGAMRGVIFKMPEIHKIAKRMVYSSFIMSVLLYGSECWCLTAKLWNKLRVFHAHCVRVIGGVSRYKQWQARITNTALRGQISISNIDTYVQRRQMAWLGRMSQMEHTRIPRRMMTCWVYRRKLTAAQRKRLERKGELQCGRPVGAPEYTWGRGIYQTLKKLGFKKDNWYEVAEDKNRWEEEVLEGKLRPKKTNKKKPALGK